MQRRKLTPCLFTLIALSALGIGHTFAQSGTVYNPVGVQNDVPVNQVLGGGWHIIYQGKFSDKIPSVQGLFRGACDQIMLATKAVSEPTFDVLASVDADVFIPLTTEHNTTVHSNGAEWYKNEYSMGFAGAGDAINQGSGDTNAIRERDRVSWHTIRITGDPNLRLNGGWRSGNHFNLNKSDEWERYILTAKTKQTSKIGNQQSDGTKPCLPVG